MKRSCSRAEKDQSYFYYGDDYTSSSESSSLNSESSEDSSENEESVTNDTQLDGIPEIPFLDDCDDVSNIQWFTAPIDRDQFIYTGNSRITFGVENLEDPLEVLEKFITYDLLSIISSETNRYAAQYIEEHKGDLLHSRIEKWYETNESEIMLFIGFLLLQGIVIMPKNSMYFSKRKVLHCPIFTELLSEKRFILLSKFLHFSNNELYDQYEKPKRLFKINPILQHFRSVFKNNYTPEVNVCIDESLLLWKGRLSWKVYIPSKRSRFGIKSYQICESSTGYIWDLFIYIGDQTVFDDNLKDLAYGEKTILQLIKPLLNKGYILTMDNYFSGLPLFNKLFDNYTEAIGTLRSNRKGIPQEMVEKKLKAGESFHLYSQKYMLVKYKDKKDIYLISTIHTDRKMTVKSKGKFVDKPEVVVMYNKTMGGVDLSDSKLTSYNTTRKRMKKYYQKQFRHLIDIACLNSFILYNKLGGKNCRLEFMIKIVENIIKKYKVRDSEFGRISRKDNPLRLSGHHFPSNLPETSKNKKPYKKCFVHKYLSDTSKRRKETRIYCAECNVAICAAPCFRIYHTVKDLNQIERLFSQVKEKLNYRSFNKVKLKIFQEIKSIYKQSIINLVIRRS